MRWPSSDSYDVANVTVFRVKTAIGSTRVQDADIPTIVLVRTAKYEDGFEEEKESFFFDGAQVCERIFFLGKIVA